MVILRQEQLDALAEGMKRALDAEAERFLRAVVPAQFAALDPAQRKQLIDSGRRKALLYGISRPEDVHRFLACLLRLGPRFDADVRGEAARILRRAELSAAARLDLIEKDCVPCR